MPNPKSLANLTHDGRPRLDNRTYPIRLSPEDKESLDAVAAQYDCFHGDKPSLSALLAKVASGELIIVPSPPTLPTADI